MGTAASSSSPVHVSDVSYESEQYITNGDEYRRNVAWSLTMIAPACVKNNSKHTDSLHTSPNMDGVCDMALVVTEDANKYTTPN